jgi:rhodanese-related sulfurtransferase
MMREIGAQAAMEMISSGKALVVDVREPAEYASGHVPGARNIPLGQLAGTRLAAEEGKALLLICASGMRSAKGCATLGEKAGALSLSGGIKAWRAAGGELEADGRGLIPLDRQVLISAGALVVFGVVMSLAVHPGWIALTGFVGAGLIFAGLTGFCGMALILARAPWNQQRAASTA